MRHLYNIATIQLHLGRLDEASRTTEEGVTLADKVLDKGDQLHGLLRANRGSLQKLGGDLEGAEASFRAALPYQESQPINRTASLHNLGVILLAQDRLEEATAVFEESLAVRRGLLPPGHRLLIHAVGALAAARLSLGDAAAAVALVEPTLADAEAAGVRDDQLAEARFALARALWESGGDRQRAVALARTARETAPPKRETVLRELELWLERHQ